MEQNTWPVTLKKSISGIRGTIGGSVGDNFTPIDIVECVSAYGWWVKKSSDKPKVVIGRDGRTSGKMVSDLASNTLRFLGIDVIDLDFSTTPTVEMAVTDFGADGGIIFTASHNPKQWNALKFLNNKGEFISGAIGEEILSYIDERKMEFADVDLLGSYELKPDYFDQHVKAILDLEVIDVDLVKSKRFHAVIDCINSTGALAIPKLLDQLDCTYELINATVDGQFAHNPEPLPGNLVELIETTKMSKADIGIAVDPDVDRLALVSEDGSYFGEEYTLVAAADFILSKTKGNTVSNLSSSRALSDITSKHGGNYFASMVGEVNVVNMMKENQAVIGGEGNGGIIYPELHYGRDALVGIAFVLNLMAQEDKPLSEIRKTYEDYTIIKNKMDLKSPDQLNEIFAKLKDKFSSEKLNDIDGLKIDFADGWVHMRMSNTEPIIRIYAEAKTQETAQALVNKVMDVIN